MNFWYKFWYSLIYIPAKLLYPCTFYGRENIPAGSAMVCANHTNFLDPVHVAMAFRRSEPLFFMAKTELFDIPVAGSIFRSGGVFPVQRGEPDIQAVRTTMKHLKSNEKVMIFPEGTRVTEAEAVEAKTGAVRIAAKAKVSIIPIFIGGEKHMFRRTTLIIGKPFKPAVPANRDYSLLAHQLMDEIWSLEQTH